MTNTQLGMQSGKGRPPYLYFRETVRPAIFAHSLLRQEEERAAALGMQEKARAGELAEMAGQILSLTRDLLRKAGLGYVVMSAEPKAPTVGAADGLRRDSVLEAFADAGMIWAEIVGNCLALADILLGQGRLDEVRVLAAALSDSGESRTAAELERRLTAAVRNKYKEPLNAIHGRMTKRSYSA
jgi:hypothetical protein